MKKFSIVLVVIGLLGALIYSQRAALSLRVLDTGLETAMSSDSLSELGDGLHVVLCGAGGPLPDPKRSGPCVAVIAGTQFFIVDAGTGGARNLTTLRYPLGAIDAVLLTHFHSDHIDGLGELGTMRWVQAAHTEALPVYGPAGVEEVVTGFNTAYAQDTVYRNAHHGNGVAPLSGRGLLAKPFTAPADGELITVLQDGDLTIQALRVDHEPVSPAVGYLFTYKKRTVLISGDTAYSSNVANLANGVDLLVHEALSPKLIKLINRKAEEAGATLRAKITFDVLDYHASPVEVAEIARDATVGHLLYYHIVPALILPGLDAAWLEGVGDVFADFTLGEDGTSFSLPAGSSDIIQTRDGM